MTWLGIRRVELASCGSTNDEAAARARSGAEHGTVVIASAQHAGRGRMARSWHSPAGQNLYLSCLLRPHLEPRAVPPITLAAGIAVCDEVTSRGVDARLKWPNDVVVGRRKLAGVLTEMATRGGSVDHAVIGIGLNANTTHFPPELGAIATSIRLETGLPVDLGDLLERLLERLEQWFDRFLAGGVAGIAESWSRRADLEHPVAVVLDGVRIEGRPAGLDHDGALIVIEDTGRRHRVVAGDVDLLPFEERTP